MEFTVLGSQAGQNRIDALTVITHELGHVLGLQHTDHGLMHSKLATGQRQLMGDIDVLDDDVWTALLDSRL